jgi:hypothetical protein
MSHLRRKRHNKSDTQESGRHLILMKDFKLKMLQRGR